MIVQRTSNAGILLELDDTRILLDGLCERVHPYLGTPKVVFQNILEDPPDAMCFTHAHPDHFSCSLTASFCEHYLRPVFGPENLPFVTDCEKKTVKSVRIMPVASRHLGMAGKDCPHFSFILEGSRCVWFMGDAAPTQWRNRGELPHPDVIIAPFAYAATESVWKTICSLTETLILVHMPIQEDDPAGIWTAVQQVTERKNPIRVVIPEVGEVLNI